MPARVSADSVDSLSATFRSRYLAVSGGWLGTFAIGAADAFGVWEISIVGVLMVLAWVIIRTSSPVLGVILGLYFDGCIPMQYHLNLELKAAHKSHLEDYWSLFLMACAVEAGGFVILREDELTLLICAKSFIMCCVWMGRDERGVFLASKIRHGDSARPSSVPNGGMNFTPSSNRLSNLTSSLSGGSSKVDLGAWPELQSERRALEKKGYKNKEALAHMLHSLSNQPSKEEQERVMKVYLSRSKEEMKAKEKEYAKKWRERQAKKGGSGTPPQTESEIQAALLKKGYKDPSALKYMLKRLKDDPEKKSSQLRTWLGGKDEHTSRNEAEYAKRWKTENPDDVVAGSGGSAASAADAGATVSGGATEQAITEPAQVILNLAQLKQGLAPMFPDPIVRDGMLEIYRSYSSIDSANAMVEEWKTNTEKRAEWTQIYHGVAQRARRWRKQLGDPISQFIPMPVDDTMEALNQRLLQGGKFTGAPQRYGMLWSIWRLPPDKQEEQMKKWLNEEELAKTDGKKGTYARSGGRMEIDLMYRTGVEDRAQIYASVFQNVKVLYDDAGQRFAHSERADERFGTGLSTGRIDMLKKQPRWQHLTISDQSKIIEVLSRPRSVQQEEAVTALLSRKSIKATFDGAYHAVATVNPCRIHPKVLQMAREEVQEMLDLYDRQTYLRLLTQVEHTPGEMKKVGQILRGLGMRPYFKVPLADDSARYHAAEYDPEHPDEVADQFSAEYLIDRTCAIRRHLPPGRAYDSLVDALYRTTSWLYTTHGKGQKVEHMWIKRINAFQVHGPEAGLAHMIREYGDPTTADPAAERDDTGAAVKMEEIRMRLREHFAENIVEALMTDHIVAYAWNRTHGQLDVSGYVRLAKAAKEPSASADKKQRYQDLVDQYERLATDINYYDRSDDEKQGSIFYWVRGTATRSIKFRSDIDR